MFERVCVDCQGQARGQITAPLAAAGDLFTDCPEVRTVCEWCGQQVAPDELASQLLIDWS